MADQTADSGPVKRLFDMSHEVRFPKLESDTGSVPVNRLVCKSIDVRRPKLPSSGGKGPLSRFNDKSTEVSCVKFPSDGTTDPNRPSPFKVREVTWQVTLLIKVQVTPVQPTQGLALVLTGHGLCQLLPPAASYKSNNASSSETGGSVVHVCV